MADTAMSNWGSCMSELAVVVIVARDQREEPKRQDDLPSSPAPEDPFWVLKLAEWTAGHFSGLMPVDRER